MPPRLNRDAAAIARFFLRRAMDCPVSDREAFEAYLEATIAFARAAFDRFRRIAGRRPGFADWWKTIRADRSFIFFNGSRNCILHEGPVRVNQVAYLGPATHPDRAEMYYYFERGSPATRTIDIHLARTEALLAEGRRRFNVP